MKAGSNESREDQAGDVPEPKEDEYRGYRIEEHPNMPWANFWIYTPEGDCFDGYDSRRECERAIDGMIERKEENA